MKKAYKETRHEGYNIIKVIDFENDTFTMYNTSKNDLPFGEKTIYTPQQMGYNSMEHLIKELKKRKFLGSEINYKQQKENEKLAIVSLKSNQNQMEV